MECGDTVSQERVGLYAVMLYVVIGGVVVVGCVRVIFGVADFAGFAGATGIVDSGVLVVGLVGVSLDGFGAGCVGGVGVVSLVGIGSVGVGGVGGVGVGGVSVVVVVGGGGGGFVVVVVGGGGVGGYVLGRQSGHHKLLGMTKLCIPDQIILVFSDRGC